MTRPGASRRRPRAGGEHPAICSARHGLAAPRGEAPPALSRGGRFGRMFPSLTPCILSREAIDLLVEQMRSKRGGMGEIPAGFTYLGQFIDHDITFDPTSKLQRDNDPGGLVNFRTPRFDLDSLYGSGPADQPFLYDWSCDTDPGVRLLVGGARDDDELARVDLPRNAQGRALIGDARNDENLVVSQLHLLFVQFHNAVVNHVAAQDDAPQGFDLFDEAQRIVRWHYQWIVVHEYLEHIVGEELACSVLDAAGGERPRVAREHFRWDGEPFIPVEFSAGAFRFGHSMVRRSYNLNSRHGEHAMNVPLFPRSRAQPGSKHLGGFRPRPEALTIDWRLFFDIEGSTQIKSMRIDRFLARPLFSLPPDGASLPQLNLERNNAMGLPSGIAVARAMAYPELTPDQLKLPGPGVAEQLRRSPPLWYYVLCEAQSEAYGDGGTHLGPVGGRIVAEVLVGLLEADPRSYLSQWPAWKPCLGAQEGVFTMADLVRFTEGGSPRAPDLRPT